jgi:predicted CoA-binding protein
MNKKTLVIGASINPERYSYKAAESLLNHGHDFELVGLKKGELFGVEIMTGFPEIKNLDTVTLYVGPKNQDIYIDYVINLNPKRVIFNPGTENEYFEHKLKIKGIQTERACTLVLLSTGCY